MVDTVAHVCVEGTNFAVPSGGFGAIPSKVLTPIVTDAKLVTFIFRSLTLTRRLTATSLIMGKGIQKLEERLQKAIKELRKITKERDDYKQKLQMTISGLEESRDMLDHLVSLGEKGLTRRNLISNSWHRKNRRLWKDHRIRKAHED